MHLLDYDQVQVDENHHAETDTTTSYPSSVAPANKEAIIILGPLYSSLGHNKSKPKR